MLAGGIMATARFIYRMPLKEYRKYALNMAVLDDEICRLELGYDEDLKRVIVWPEKSETLLHRYDLFIELNRFKGRKKLDEEILVMEERLRALKEEAGE